MSALEQIKWERDIAIKQLEEIGLGLGEKTDRVCEALEKQIPKKPIGTYTDFKCSVCGRRVRSGKGSSSRQRDNFCQRCGQKLDWGE